MSELPIEKPLKTEDIKLDENLQGLFPEVGEVLKEEKIHDMKNELLMSNFEKFIQELNVGKTPTQ